MTPLPPDQVANLVTCAEYAIAHPTPFAVAFTIESQHLSDVVDHVPNTDYVHWLDRVAEMHSDACNYTRSWLLNENIMWFVARHEIDYCAECTVGDELVATTWVRSFDRVKSWRDYVIVRPADKTIVCKASTLWVLVDLPTRRPKRIPQEMAERFAPLIETRSKTVSSIH